MKRIALLLCLSFFATSSHAAEAPAMPTTSLHRAIVQQSDWLNTSRPLTAEDLKGRIILLDFWTFCCINCMHVIPDLHHLEKTFGDKLTVIGVHSAKFLNERDSENIRNAILRYDIEHAVVNDSNFAVWQSFGVRAWPTFVLINPDGMMEEIYSGEGNREAVEADVRRLIQKYEGKLTTSPLPIALEKNKAPRHVLNFPGKLAYVENYRAAPALAITDSANHRVLLTDLSGGIVAQFGSGTLGFKDGDGKTAQFHSPQGLLADKEFLYVADTENHALRRISLATGQVETLAGTGKQGYERRLTQAPARTTPLASPWDLAFYPDNAHIAIAMAGTHQLWSYDIAQKTVSVLAGNGRESIDDGSYPFNSLSQPSGLAVLGETLYFVDSETSSLRALKRGKIETLIGTGLFDFGYKEGTRREALMQHPLGIFADESGIYVADSYNHSVRRFEPSTATLHDYAGHGVRGSADGTLAAASFNEPNALLRIDDKLYVADTNNHRIRVIDMTAKTVSTLPVGGEAVAPSAADAPPAPEVLPNLEILPAQSVSMTAGILNLALAEGWKINDEAPSALWVEDEHGKRLREWPLAHIKSQRVALPTMDDGQSYRVRGTLYYCEKAQGAQCLIKSVELPLTATADAPQEISLKVN